MQIILTHQNADFDAVASMLGAHKLYPAATPILPMRVNRNVSEFLALYRNGLPFVNWRDFKTREPITQVVITDTQTTENVRGVKPGTPTLIIEHHPAWRAPVPHETLEFESVGAITTYVVEQIQARQISITTLEATLLALGIYEDTGMLTYGGTTPRDARAIAWLLEQGAVLDTIQRFLTHTLNNEQKSLFDTLVKNGEALTIHGYTVMICTAIADKSIEGISSITTQLLETLDATAVIVLVQFGDTIQMVTRSTDDAVNVGELTQRLGGGGHVRAAAGTIHERTLPDVVEFITHFLRDAIQPPVRISDLMSTNPRTLQAGDIIKDLIPVIRRIGHEGYPVLENGQVIGLMTLRDADRAIEHHLSNATVQEVMQGGSYTILPSAAIAELEQLMVTSGWGQIPVVDENGKLCGIVTRTDLLKHWAHTHPTSAPAQAMLNPADIETYLGQDSANLIARIAEFAQQHHTTIYMVGGVVRDLLLKRPNQDIDFVVEGDAIGFAQSLCAAYGGRIHSHAPFGTAKWHLDEQLAALLQAAHLPEHLDFVTARNEFYEHPTALPTVYSASIRPDMARRDFTINTLAVQLSPAGAMWRIQDIFGGISDLEQKLIRVLHSLSFVDDPTRILRAVRFSERLRFTIEPRTAELIGTALPMLRRITGERLWNELTLLLQETEPERGLLKLEALHALENIHPALHFLPSTAETFQRLRTQHPDTLQDDTRADLYWFAWLTQLDEIADICERLLIGSTRAQAIVQVAALLREQALLTDRTQRVSHLVRRIEKLDEEAQQMALILLDESARRAFNNVLEKARTLHPIANGNTLKAMGIPPSPAYKHILEALRAAWLDGEVQNEQDETALLQRLIREHT